MGGRQIVLSPKLSFKLAQGSKDRAIRVYGAGAVGPSGLRSNRMVEGKVR